MKAFKISTSEREQIRDVTSVLRDWVSESGFSSGLLALYCPHTTAALTLNENADPDVKRDILHHLKKTVPRSPEFRHFEDNADAHIKSILTGFSCVLMVEKGRMLLGRWQGVYFCEFDGPKDRELWAKFMPDPGA
jgi:secondary thiamine-phosphate synthase enzyme